MYLFVIALISLQYGLSIVFFLTNRYSKLVYLYVFSIFSYDYLFINASYYLPDILVNLLKPYNEYFFLILLLLVIQKVNSVDGVIKLRHIDKSVLYLLLLPTSIILLLNDFSQNIDLMSTVQGLRTYLIPILIPYLMYNLYFLNKLNIGKFVNFLIFLSILTVLYGLYQKYTYNGQISSLWFYDFFGRYKENPVEEGFYNFVRNDQLRTTSIFVSPVIYSIALSIPTLLVISKLFKEKKLIGKINLVLVLSFLIWGLMIAETRVGLFVTIIGLLILISCYIRILNRYAFLLAIPIVFIVLTFITMIFGYTEDLSALGRLIQYASFFDYFKVLGLGFNNKYVLTYFDTFYVSIFLVYGVLAFLPIIFIFKLNKLIYKLTKSSFYGRFFNVSTLAVSLSFVYSFAFQFTAGAYPYKLLFVLVFIAFNNRNLAADGR
jgi:hypothetical protein